MPVSQRFIDLLNMPVPALRQLAIDRQVEIPPGTKKWDVAHRLASSSREELEEASEGFLYAGSTSLSWFRFAHGDEEIDTKNPESFYPLSGEEFDTRTIPEALAEHAEGDPFSEDQRPGDITAAPKLIVAREWRDGFVMTFAVARRAGHVIHNFEAVEVLEDEFFAAFLRPADGTFEVRASAARADQLHSAWLASFAHSLNMQAIPVAITEEDVRALRDEIGGRLRKFGGSEATGTSAIGTVTYGKADTCEDLFDEEEFAEKSEGYDAVAYDLLFDYDDIENISIHISTLKGSVHIRTAVGENVVNYVYDALRASKT